MMKMLSFLLCLAIAFSSISYGATQLGKRPKAKAVATKGIFGKNGKLAKSAKALREFVSGRPSETAEEVWQSPFAKKVAAQNAEISNPYFKNYYIPFHETIKSDGTRYIPPVITPRDAVWVDGINIDNVLVNDKFNIYWTGPEYRNKNATKPVVFEVHHIAAVQGSKYPSIVGYGRNEKGRKIRASIRVVGEPNEENRRLEVTIWSNSGDYTNYRVQLTE